MKPHSQKFLQQRKFYMMLPVLVLPFLTIIFWALGGGKGISQPLQRTPSGLNVELPIAYFDKNREHWNKLTLYDQARRDSLRHQQARKSDPYYEVALLGTDSKDSVPVITNKLNASLGSSHRDQSLRRQEQHINEKLAELNTRLSSPEITSSYLQQATAPAMEVHEGETMPEDIARLEKMMAIMANSQSNDPELKQIDGVLDKILDIQHPDRLDAKGNMHGDTHLQAVTPARAEENITLLGTTNFSVAIAEDSVGLTNPISIQPAYNAFFGLSEADTPSITTSNHTFPAVIHDTQTVVSGSTIKMRLLDEVYIGDKRLPKDHFIYGLCSVKGERLSVTITAIRLNTDLIPVSLEVHDLDGQQGIYIPGALTRDAAKQASTQSVQDLQLNSFDNSLEGQAASAGIEAAKGLLTKKVKLVEVTVKAGYQILLHDTSAL